MDEEKKLVLCVVALVYVTVLYAFLFVALWPYRTSVGLSLLGFLSFVVVLWRVIEAQGKLNEQELRHLRIAIRKRHRWMHRERRHETPFDRQ